MNKGISYGSELRISDSSLNMKQIIGLNQVSIGIQIFVNKKLFDKIKQNEENKFREDILE